MGWVGGRSAERVRVWRGVRLQEPGLQPRPSLGASGSEFPVHAAREARVVARLQAWGFFYQ